MQRTCQKRSSKDVLANGSSECVSAARSRVAATPNTTQKVALDLRAKGVDYNPRKHGNKKSTPKRKPATAKEDDKPHKPRRAPTVIIVPIFWNTKAAEKDAVIAAARLCMQRISDAGIKVDLDTTNTHTPGAKFRYWEERGVKFRVELGPEDVANGTAVLAICGAAVILYSFGYISMN